MADYIYTEAEIKKARAEFEQNELYRKSVSIYKDYQLEQFADSSNNNKIMEGRNSRTDLIDGKEVLVIFTFKNGFLDSPDDTTPAIEYPNHWEFWKGGLIQQVVDVPTGTVEIWENGVPVEIKDYNPRQQ